MAKVIKTHAIEADGVEFFMAELSDISKHKYSVGVRDTDADETVPAYRLFLTRESAEKHFEEIVKKA